MENILYINGKKYSFHPEARNLLEVIRANGIQLPTFCYHSELSIYGACRLCVVDVEGRGIQASCSLKPESGMRIKTHTEELRQVRKTTMSLLLASHKTDCPSCPKETACKLKEVAKQVGVEDVPYKQKSKDIPLDDSTHALQIDHSKCILCGDCVRACKEIQGIGVLDFVGRGKDVVVTPVFHKQLKDVECVQCGQCASVCPTGAISVKNQINQVWEAINNTDKVVVAQVAPAVRVALGEEFGLQPGEMVIGQTAAALKKIGFDYVYDTAFAADLTIIEEGDEFLTKLEKGEKLPHFTSCCPAWVKYAEQFHPELLKQISTCKSPQQMMGTLIKKFVSQEINVPADRITVVSIMPCTAKKEEAKRPEFFTNEQPDVDVVLTTQEIAAMIREMGLDFASMEPASLDLPFGFKTGAGVLFGASGGVTEAVVRFIEKKEGVQNKKVSLLSYRSEDNYRTFSLETGGKTIKFGIVSGLKKAEELIGKIESGEEELDFIEVMACPHGCAGGAGQPVSENVQAKIKRRKAIYESDTMLQLHSSDENPVIQSYYKKYLGEPGGELSHQLLHTHYTAARRINHDGISVSSGIAKEEALKVSVCVGTGCYIKGSQTLLHKLLKFVEENRWNELVDIKATFCFERCDLGPTITIDDEMIHHCDLEKAKRSIEEKIKMLTYQ